MPKQDIVRVTRIVIYEGPRSLVESQIARSIHGTKTFSSGPEKSRVYITARTLEEFPQIIEEHTQAVDVQS